MQPRDNSTGSSDIEEEVTHFFGIIAAVINDNGLPGQIKIFKCIEMAYGSITFRAQVMMQRTVNNDIFQNII